MRYTPHIFRPHADMDRSRRWDSAATTTARTGFTILAAFALAIGAGFLSFRTPLGTPFCAVHWFSFYSKENGLHSSSLSPCRTSLTICSLSSDDSKVLSSSARSMQVWYVDLASEISPQAACRPPMTANDDHVGQSSLDCL